MKDKQGIKKIGNALIVILVVLTFVAVIYAIYYNFKKNLSNFWLTSISDVVTMIIALVFTYYFVQRKNDKRKQKEIIEKNIIKIQKYIYDEEIYNIFSKENNNSLTRSIKIRKIKNLITYLTDYSKKFDFVNQMQEVSKNFKQYQNVTEAMTQDNDFSEKSKNNVKRIIETLDDNLEEILHKIYL